MMKLDGGNARSQGLIAMRRRNGACYYFALFLQIHFIFPLLPLKTDFKGVSAPVGREFSASALALQYLLTHLIYRIKQKHSAEHLVFFTSKF